MRAITEITEEYTIEHKLKSSPTGHQSNIMAHVKIMKVSEYEELHQVRQSKDEPLEDPNSDRKAVKQR